MRTQQADSPPLASYLKRCGHALLGSIPAKQGGVDRRSGQRRVPGEEGAALLQRARLAHVPEVPHQIDRVSVADESGERDQG